MSGTYIDFEKTAEKPPLGNGSMKLLVLSGSNAAQFRLSSFSGTKLSDITDMSYYTHVASASGGLVPYIILNVDQNGDGTIDDLLFFEPFYQDGSYGPSLPSQGDIMANSWQKWDAAHGGWWSAYGDAGAMPGTGIMTLSQYAVAFPKAVIANSSLGGGIRIAVGFGDTMWNNSLAHVDALTVGTAKSGTVTYDFEPLLTVKSAADCKNNGWMQLDSPAFSSQTECVNFVLGKMKKSLNQ
ncbi:MAG: hypothetical protein JWM56_846 [Candidatus Peribacteria bacterium]|nr:hypothetical protein [Candidatus Peribacteria bacterium]